MPEQRREYRGDGDAWEAALEAREWVRGRKPDEPEPHSHAGLVDDEQVRDLLSHLANHYNPRAVDADMPANVEDTRLWNLLLSTASTETVQAAVREGRSSTLSFGVGDPARRSDVSGIKAIQQIEGVMDKEAPIVYLAGEPGSGKTNFALLLAQIWSRIQEREGRSYQLASNIRTWEEQDSWIERFSRLEEWATEYVEDLPDGGSTLRDGAPRKLYVFDEASSHAMGIGEQGYQTAMLLGPLVKKIRKGNAGLIIIGHDGKDVAPAVRVLAVFIRRYVENIKRATLYRNIRNRQGEDKIVDVRGVPQTDFTYDDKEATRFVWDLDGDLDDEVLDAAADLAEDAIEDDRRRVAAQLYLNDSLDASQTDIARAMGDYSQSWVSRAVDAYQRGELSTDGDGMAIQ
jgi:hypothetical protein